MDSDSFNAPVAGIVRRYSAQVEAAMPNSLLAHAVSAHEADLQTQERQATEWKKWLKFEVVKHDSVDSALLSEAERTAELWRKMKMDFDELGPLDDNPPTVGVLWNAVQGAQEQWDKKREKGFGKAKSQIFSFFETMDAHKYLFSLIPNGDKYTCLFTGVVTSIVKASMNHEQVAEGLTRALQEISEDLDFVNRGTQICNSPKVKRYVISLYGEFFSFLCNAMEWYHSSWNRFTKAFNNKFYDKKVEQKVKKIQTLVNRVRDEMRLTTDKMMGTGFIETNKNIFLARDQVVQAVDKAIGKALDEKLEAAAKLMGQQMSSTLQANLEHTLYLRLEQLMLKSGESGDHRISSIPDNSEHTSREGLESFLPSFAPYVDDGREKIQASLTTNGMLVLPQEAVKDVQRWIEAKESNLLWIEGPAYGAFQFEDPLSVIGSRVCSITEHFEIPCISFFAKMKYGFESADVDIKDVRLVSMLYTLITQLIRALPPTFNQVDTLTEDMFCQLDGTSKSAGVAIKILRALLSLVEPGLVCVINRFHLVDSQETLAVLIDMIEALQAQPAEKRVKVLFTSSGNCRSLSRATSIRQRSDATRMVLAKGASPLPGGATAQHITAPSARHT